MSQDDDDDDKMYEAVTETQSHQCATSLIVF
jgi:hypothetical protein